MTPTWPRSTSTRTNGRGPPGGATRGRRRCVIDAGPCSRRGRTTPPLRLTHVQRPQHGQRTAGLAIPAAQPRSRSRATSTPSRPATGSSGPTSSASASRSRPRGEGTLLVYRSTRAGRAAARDIATGRRRAPMTHEIELPVTSFGDGGWYWFDVVASGSEVVLGRRTGSRPRPRDCAPAEPRSASPRSTSPTTAWTCSMRSLLTTTSATSSTGVHRRPGHPAGSRRAPGFDAVPQSSAIALRVIEQPNLGGSGGFARAMSETLDAGESDFVILLDDDVAIEPESIARAVDSHGIPRARSSSAATCSTCYEPPGAARVRRDRRLKPFIWHAQPHDDVPHDFRVSNLRQTPWMHARMDADYNGWWMCLIPTEVVRESASSLPAFIKWDDAEYCLRARDAGYPTVTPSRRGPLARLVARQGRLDRLAGVLPRPQSARRRPAPLAAPEGRPAAPQQSRERHPARADARLLRRDPSTARLQERPRGPGRSTASCRPGSRRSAHSPRTSAKPP